MSYAEENIKRPNVAGQFYPGNSNQLASEIDAFLKRADVSASDKHIDIIISPHAGYVYSGWVAAYGFKVASKNKYSTIIVIAPSHYLPFSGVSVSLHDGFETPLGIIPVDHKLAEKIISANDNFYFEPKAFEKEHAVEVELPFLQKVFKDFKIVPIIMGQPDFQTVRDFANTLLHVIGSRKDVLIVISTDMSHFHNDAFARKIDKHTLEAVKALDAEGLWKENRAGTMELCGYVPVTAALLYARAKGLKAEDVKVLKYATSADVTGDNSRVVGYSSIVIYDSDKDSTSKKEDASEIPALTKQQKRRLIDIARRTIEQFVRTGKVLNVRETDPRLCKEEGAFVTITKHGMLRGCIGNIIGHGPLYLTVRDMAIAAASQDPRFPPLRENELDDIEIEISVLSKPHVVKSADEIKMGVHGVIVSQGLFHQGVFLPQVAKETGWSKEKFLSELCSQKAGLPPDAWKDPRTKLEVFTADVFSEKDVEEQ